MTDVVQVVLGSGLLATLITSLANFVVSYRLMKSTKTLEKKKLLTAFRTRNLDLLRELRTKVEADFGIKPVADAIEQMGQQDDLAAIAILTEHVNESQNQTRQRILEYRKCQSCFRKSTRAHLDAAAQRVESLEQFLGELAVKKIGSPAEEWVGELLDKVAERADTSAAFDLALARAVDEEMCYLADWLDSVETTR